MKKLTSKCISFILLIVLIFCSTFNISYGLGNPLDDHPEYYAEMRHAFAQKYANTQNNESSFLWEKKPNYWFYSNDYRKICVYNMHHLANIEVPCNFFKSSIKLLDKALACAKIANEVAKASGKVAVKLFKEYYEKEEKGTREIKIIADFLGTNEDVAMQSVIQSIGMTWINGAAHLLSIVACLSGSLEALTVFNPFAGIAASVALDVLCIATGVSKFANERAVNYSQALYTVWSIMINDPDKVLNSNVLITAVDERDFYSMFRHNVLRRNDESWCDFAKIGGLDCAPLGSTIPRIRQHLKDFRNLAINGNCLSYTKLKDLIPVKN